MAFRYVTPAEPNRDPADISSFPLRQASPPWRRHRICYAVLRFLSEPPPSHQEDSLPRTPIDLTSHLNKTVERGHPADFPVTLQPVFVRQNGGHTEVPHRR